jgi:hypothetical protein
MRWWLRGLACGAAVGLLVGFVVGGTLGRAFMRLLFLSREESRGIETAMGAIIGDFTAGGTIFIGIFGAIMGVGLGVVYVCLRSFMPSGLWRRELVFVGGASALMLGLLTRINLDDFAVLPATLSVLLIAASVALTAMPVPFVVERIAPDRERRPGAVSNALVAAGLLAAIVFASTGVALAYAQ